MLQPHSLLVENSLTCFPLQCSAVPCLHIGLTLLVHTHLLDHCLKASVLCLRNLWMWKDTAFSHEPPNSRRYVSPWSNFSFQSFLFSETSVAKLIICRGSYYNIQPSKRCGYFFFPRNLLLFKLVYQPSFQFWAQNSMYVEKAAVKGSATLGKGETASFMFKLLTKTTFVFIEESKICF